MKPVHWTRQISWSIDVPRVIDAFLLLEIQVCMHSSGGVNVFHWKRMNLLSARKVLLCVLQRDGGKWSFLTLNHFLLYQHPEMSHEVVETLLISKKIYVTFSSNWTFSYQGGHQVFPSCLRILELKECPSYIQWHKRLATVSCCKKYQHTFQYDRHALHCVLGSVSSNSNNSMLPTSWIIVINSGLKRVIRFVLS